MNRYFSNRTLALGLSAAALFFAAVRILLFVRYPLQINHDCALLLQQAQLMVDGWTPYVDFIEINPPLILYMKALPIWVARLLSINVITAFHLCVLLLAFWSTLSIRDSLKVLTSAEHSLAPLAIPAAYLAFVTFFIGIEFGQREHIFALLFLPFLFARMLNWEGRALTVRRGIVLGIAAALGVCLKPAFLVIAVLPELYWFIVKRNYRPLLDPAFIAFALTGLAYAAHFFLLPAAMYAAYFDRWMPEMLRHYRAYERGFSDIVLQRHFIVPLFIAIAGFGASFALDTNPARRVRALVYAAVGAAFVYYVQSKGWKYHALPLTTIAALIVAAIASWANDSAQERAGRTVASSQFALFARVAMAALLVFFALSGYRISSKRHAR
ncbi:MAG: hypothetical protein IPG71_00460 [bacterium]|nr:hypothetical protein [bacterium]